MSVSIVIPTYNRAALVAELAEAALDEANSVGGEVVVVDDGSTDDTRERLSGLPLRLFSIANGGVSAARNHGLEQARHPFIRFLDSDDLPVPGSTSRLLAAIGGGIVAAGLCAEDGEGGLVPSSTYGLAVRADPAVRLADVVSGRLVLGAALLRRDALVAVGGFDAQSRFAEDYDLMMRGWAAGWTGLVVPELAYHVRHLAGERLSRTPKQAQYGHFAAKMERNAERLRPMLGSDPEARTAFGQMLWRNGRDAARAGYRAEAERLFALALRSAGPAARAGRPAARTLARLLGAYRAETMLSGLKKAVSRTT